MEKDAVKNESIIERLWSFDYKVKAERDRISDVYGPYVHRSSVANLKSKKGQINFLKYNFISVNMMFKLFISCCSKLVIMNSALYFPWPKHMHGGCGCLYC